METNGESVRGFSWRGLTQEIHIAFKNTASQQKVAIVSSRVRSIFRAFPALFVDALGFVLSTSAKEQPSSSLIRDSGLGAVV